MDPNPPMPAPLPVIRIICDAFRFVWDRRTRLLLALAVPMALILMVDTVFAFADDDPLKWLQTLVQMAIYILFAITCHRLALIGDPGVPKYGLLKWTAREWRYLGWSLVIISLFMLYSFAVNSALVSTLATNLEVEAVEETFRTLQYLSYVAYIPAVYILSRLSVLYPATALDRQVDMRWAWQLTVDHGWRLTIVVGLFPWVLYFLVSLLLRDNPTWVELILFNLIGFFLFAVEVVALSFSYKHLAATES